MPDDPTQPDQPAPEPETPATETAATESAPLESAAPRELPPPDTEETVRAVLRFTRERPDDEDALAALLALREHLLRTDIRKDVMTSARAVFDATLARDVITPALHAHLVILFSAMLDFADKRDAVDEMLARWIRRDGAFGDGHVTPPEFQKPDIVQRFADLLGWGTLEIKRDHDAIKRFLMWIDSWSPSGRKRVRRAIDILRRNFPAKDLWQIVRPW